MEDRRSNTEFVHDLMELHPCGSMGQLLVIEALRVYCEKILAQDEKEILARDLKNEQEDKIPLISEGTWYIVARKTQELLDKKYEHNKYRQSKKRGKYDH